MSRQQLARALQVEKQTIGRYERGEWVTPPRAPAVEALADATKIPDDARARLLAALEQTRREYFDTEHEAHNARREVAAMGDDPATQFSDEAEREAQRRGERSASDEEDRPGEDAGDADQ